MSWRALTCWPNLVTAAIPICPTFSAEVGPSGDGPGNGFAPGTGARIRGHLLVIHGQNDSLGGVDAALGELTAAGILHEVMVFDDEGPGILRRTNLETRLMRAAVLVERAFAEGLR
jgi:hypothetical protein